MKYLTKKQYGQVVGLSLRSVDRWIAQKKIRTRILVTGGVRIPDSEIEKAFKPNIQEFLSEGKYK